MPPITILYIEDYRLLRVTVQETLEMEGWQVDVCEDGIRALAKIESERHYDALLVDNALPGVHGLELVRQARGFEHRKRTPIILISASECELEARDAGADVFLKKPDDINKIVQTIARLLKTSQES